MRTLTLLLVALLGIWGCGRTQPDLTDEQTQELEVVGQVSSEDNERRIEVTRAYQNAVQRIESKNPHPGDPLYAPTWVFVRANTIVESLRREGQDGFIAAVEWLEAESHRSAAELEADWGWNPARGP